MYSLLSSIGCQFGDKTVVPRVVLVRRVAALLHRHIGTTMGLFLKYITATLCMVIRWFQIRDLGKMTLSFYCTKSVFYFQVIVVDAIFMV